MMRVAMAKRDLKAGERLDGMGGFTCYGMVDSYENCRRNDDLPIALSGDCVLKRDVAKDAAISYRDVTLPQGRMCEFRPSPGSPVPMPGRRRWLAIVGSVGQPRDRNPAAAYALFDRRLEQLTFHRVAYDAGAAANSIRRSGLPESLAFRVELGI